MRPDTIKFAASIILLTVLTNSCEKPEKTEYIYLKQPVCGTIFTPKSYDYQVVGFYPSWKLSVPRKSGWSFIPCRQSSATVGGRGYFRERRQVRQGSRELRGFCGRRE